MKADGGNGVVERCNLPVLPDDIVVEILVRLPVKALLQFKRVCKSWRTRISSPQFAMDNFHQRYSHLPSPTTSVVSFDMSYYMGSLVIRGSCNGLLCLHHVRSDNICLWNPCTRFASQWFPVDKLSLSYFGFGYDHVMTNTRYIGKFLNGTGTLNWMAKVKEKNWVILSLDLANETFRQVSLPTLYGASDNSCDPELQILRNCLSFSIDHRDIIFDVWMMKDYGVWESWTLISRVNIWRHSCSYPLTPLSISENDVLLLIIPNGRLVLFKADVDLFCYPQIDSSSDGLVHFPMCSGGRLWTYFVHHDSLVMPPQ
ncbi:hypothetical protein PIB30_005161 [Stylosanthes scabra]|uniref:F-box domain-containing protein n=1 Tax=Stylosanthes scabra TaxID=79078 RepID=A0ABU6R2S8_9FABA|nr:hypothetical protein [Stylosanthes scabra]